MTLRIRRDAEIYEIDGGWFHARWHFSFDQYRDAENDSFGAMRVFNDDRLVPGAAWPLHPHRDVEGLTYVVEGTFGHEDNVGCQQLEQLVEVGAGAGGQEGIGDLGSTGGVGFETGLGVVNPPPGPAGQLADRRW